MSNSSINDFTNNSSTKNIFSNVINKKKKNSLTNFVSESKKSVPKDLISGLNLNLDDNGHNKVEQCALKTSEDFHVNHGINMDSVHPYALLPISILAKPKYLTSYINKYIKPKSAKPEVNPTAIKRVRKISNKSKAKKRLGDKPKRNVKSKLESCQNELSNTSNLTDKKMSKENVKKFNSNEKNQKVTKESGIENCEKEKQHKVKNSNFKKKSVALVEMSAPVQSAQLITEEWGKKLMQLAPIQRHFAEEAIEIVLSEAAENKLKWNSVYINKERCFKEADSSDSNKKN